MVELMEQWAQRFLCFLLCVLCILIVAVAMDAGAEARRMGECEHARKVLGVVQGLPDECHLLGIVSQADLWVAAYDIRIKPDELAARARSSRREN